MTNKDEVKFIIKEINAERMYRKIRNEYKQERKKLDDKIVQLSYPKCPNNKTEGNSDKSKIEVLYDLIEEKDSVEKKIAHFDERIVMVEQMKEEIYENDDGFLQDFFKGLSYKALEKKHCITNPYKLAESRIIRAINTNRYETN